MPQTKLIDPEVFLHSRSNSDEELSWKQIYLYNGVTSVITCLAVITQAPATILLGWIDSLIMMFVGLFILTAMGVTALHKLYKIVKDSIFVICAQKLLLHRDLYSVKERDELIRRNHIHASSLRLSIAIGNSVAFFGQVLFLLLVLLF